ncbi:MAG: methyl-accepting chemotaxis protein [Cyanobacteriota bacterium]|nr:methyl-accepting chemotaxis protein [Cyanobacteriota bacterium]
MTTPNSSLPPTTHEASSADSSAQLMSQLLSANSLEQAGSIEEAAHLYQQIIEADPQGTYRLMAEKALAALGRTPAPPATSQPQVIVHSASRQTSGSPSPGIPTSATPPPTQHAPWIAWFYDLPISLKQLLFLLVFEVSSLSMVGAGAWLINLSLRNQLINQAKSELAVTQTNYNSQLDQLAASFRSQANNPIILAAAQKASQGEGDLVPLLQPVEALLKQEAQARQLEIATLVGADRRILASVNSNRRGQEFNPDSLISEVLAYPRQIKASNRITPTEIQQEGFPLPPELAGQPEALIRYVVTPVVDGKTQRVLGVLIAGDLVNGDFTLVETTLATFGVQFQDTSLRVDGGYSGVYLNQDGSFLPVVTANQGERGLPQPDVLLPEEASLSLLEPAVRDPKLQPVTQRVQVGNRWYTMAAQALPNKIIEEETESVAVATGEPAAILIRGTPETALNTLLNETLLRLLIVAAIVVVVHLLLAIFLSRVITNPLRLLGQVAQAFSRGERQVRAPVQARDEVGQLGKTFNSMVDSIMASEQVLAEQAAQRQAEAERQRQLKENLEQSVVNLLLEIEGAQQGDLTVQAPVVEGEVGSIADAFNATIRSLRQLVSQVKGVANRVNHLAQTSEKTARQLSPDALKQSSELTQTLKIVAESTQSIQRVAQSSQEAAEISRRAAHVAEVGEQAMDQTVASMEKIRTSAADTAKQVKRLAESSQEISQIVAIIAGIADKTNLLAFNASLEAARAGEHGQGFRSIADEVRRLASQVNEFSQEIETLVTGIQQETADVLKEMEIGTSEVVSGTQLVSETQKTLRELVRINQEIDRYLASVSADTQAQTLASQQVNQTIEEVAEISQNTSQEAQSIVTSLQELVLEVQALQASVAKFQVEESGIPSFVN